MTRAVCFIFCCLISLSCDQLKNITESAGAFGPPSRQEITAGIKEALETGIKNAVLKTAQENGFYHNPLLRIPFPEEAAKVESTLRNLGLNKQVDLFIETLNHGAEKAAAKATPIFIEAIKAMTIQDVYDIWRGEKDAATRYLQAKTREALAAEFRPVIRQALDQVDITRYWTPLINAYNQIPLTESLNPNLDEYVLDKTLTGLFNMLALEEEKIREDPSARVTNLLKKVFGYNGPAPQNLY